MDKFWADMIMEGKTTFSKIRSESRRNAVKRLFDQYLQEGKITQEEYNQYLGIDIDESEEI